MLVFNMLIAIVTCSIDFFNLLQGSANCRFISVHEQKLILQRLHGFINANEHDSCCFELYS